MLYWLFTKLIRPAWAMLILAGIYFMAQDMARGNTFWTLFGAAAVGAAIFQFVRHGDTSR